MSKIIVKELSKTIRHNKVLDNISLELDAGGVYGFCGRNASGKTMLLRAIAGLLVPTSGSVEVFGKLLKGGIFPDSMGIMLADVELVRYLTGYENMELLAATRGKAGKKEIERAMERVDLDPSDRRKYKAYSTGMKRRLVIAQAIMESPQLLILDEPTNGLDDGSVKLFHDIILEEKARGATCLISTHLIDDIFPLCDRIFKISQGCCTEMAAIKEGGL
ncbi:MAG: ABC transporter ATP-binding protein [Clostridia bacterium]|nr:ABC transporter ATP-binding protein [Clostridia bacterium]